MAGATTGLSLPDGLMRSRDEAMPRSSLPPVRASRDMLRSVPVSEATDAALADSAQAGDQAAFGELMRRHKSWLYRFVRRHVRDAEDAQDVLQESFIAVWNGISGYDRNRSFPIWLRRIALNKCRDRARRMMVRRFIQPWSSVSPEVEPADPVMSAETGLIEDENLKRVRNAIDALPRSCREPLILVAIEGLSHIEAGEVLNISPKAIEGRIYRAKIRLSQLLNLEENNSSSASKSPHRDTQFS